MTSKILIPRFCSWLLLLTVVVIAGPNDAAVSDLDPNLDSIKNDASVSGTGNSDIIVLEDFSHPIHKWKEMNDPVMGGKSTGTFTISQDAGSGRFVGEVVDVPFLHAPGFLQALTTGSFPDISSCQGLQVVGVSHSDYTGFRISLGVAHAPGGKFFAYGYKTNLVALNVTLPFDQFTDFWDDATGNPIHTCAENNLYCPTDKALRNLRKLAVWAEGVAGKVDLSISKIQAIGCASWSENQDSDLTEEAIVGSDGNSLRGTSPS